MKYSLKKKLLHRIVWRCSYHTETDTNRFPFGSCTNPSVSVSFFVPVSASVNTPLKAENVLELLQTLTVLYLGLVHTNRLCFRCDVFDLREKVGTKNIWIGPLCWYLLISTEPILSERISESERQISQVSVNTQQNKTISVNDVQLLISTKFAHCKPSSSTVLISDVRFD